MKELSIKTMVELHSRIAVCYGGDLGRLARTSLTYDKCLLIMACDLPEKLKARLKKYFPGETFLMSSGRGKGFPELKKIWKLMFTKGFSRNSLIVAAGGGKVSDMAGLAAALYMRGIKWVSIPTTLLSQVDAAIGGKTAVDLAGVKNVIGSFYLPALSLLDISLLEGLPANRFMEAFGEIYKYIMITTPKVSAKIARLLPAVKKMDKKAVYECVLECARFKAEVVEKDFFEENGFREILNFGHTGGHAIEVICGLPHGIALWWGIKYALGLSFEMGIMRSKEYLDLLAILGLRDRQEIAKLKGNFRRFLNIVHSDKKKRCRDNYFVLLKRRGVVFTKADIPENILRKVFEELESRYQYAT